MGSSDNHGNQDESKRILVVEDVEFNQQILVSLLDGQGFVAETVASGEAALALLTKDQNFAMILMDIGLPGMDGVETCRRIKENPITRLIPVIALTAQPETERDRFLNAGMDGFAEKNFDPDHLASEMSRHLCPAAGRRTAQATTAAGHASLRLDLLRATYGEDAIIGHIARAFFKDTDPLIGRLGQAMDNGDLAEIRACCHGIKGAAVLFTADGVAALTERFSTLVKQDDPAASAAALAELQEAYKTLWQWCKEFLGT